MKLIYLLALISAVLVAWDLFPSDVPTPVGSTPVGPLQDSTYVFVYGRDRCGLTKRMLSNPNRAQVPYTYKIVDDPRVDEELRPRMKHAGLKTRRFGLPVVDVNGEIMIRPHIDVVVTKYARARVVERNDGPSTFTKTERLPDGTSGQ
jgi:hypothetical protein